MHRWFTNGAPWHILTCLDPEPPSCLCRRVLLDAEWCWMMLRKAKNRSGKPKRMWPLVPCRALAEDVVTSWTLQTLHRHWAILSSLAMVSFSKRSVRPFSVLRQAVCSQNGAMARDSSPTLQNYKMNRTTARKCYIPCTPQLKDLMGRRRAPGFIKSKGGKKFHRDINIYHFAHLALRS